MAVDPQQAEQVGRIFQSLATGGMPQGQPQGQPGQPPQGMPQQGQPPQQGAKTNQEKATDKAAPNDVSGDRDMPPATIKVKMGEEERELTDTQIKGMLERYSSLNDKHANFKPLLQIAEQLTERLGGDSKKAQQVIGMALKQALTEKNPTMGQQSEKGGQPTGQQGTSNEDISKAFQAWEEENGAKLPPGYKEIHQFMGEFPKQMTGMQEMMRRILATAGGQTDAAKEAMGQAGQAVAGTAKARVGVNLDMMRQRLNLDDSQDEAKAFLTFAGERGYTMEDFIDPSLTIKVGQDYVNAKNSGELNRLLEVNKRRLAAAGGVGSGVSDGGGVGSGQPNPNDAQIGRIFESVKKQRHIA